jgi:HK97 family phage prohead protease
MNFEHQQGIQGTIGRGAELRNTSTACEGTFRMLNHPDADKALELVNEGILNGVSVEAIPEKSIRGEDGVVRRVKARLVNIALCRSPAFPAAQVLAVREKPDEPEEPWEEPGAPDDPPIEQPGVPDPPPPEAAHVDAALARIGYEPLLTRTIVQTPWDNSPERFTDDEFRRSCLIDRGGEAKDRCSVPVLEPNGDINANALEIAARLINGVVRVTPEQKSAAARKLLRYYRQAGMDAPQRVRQLAAR